MYIVSPGAHHHRRLLVFWQALSVIGILGRAAMVAYDESRFTERHARRRAHPLVEFFFSRGPWEANSDDAAASAAATISATSPMPVQEPKPVKLRKHYRLSEATRLMSGLILATTLANRCLVGLAFHHLHCWGFDSPGDRVAVGCSTGDLEDVSTCHPAPASGADSSGGSSSSSSGGGHVVTAHVYIAIIKQLVQLLAPLPCIVVGRWLADGWVRGAKQRSATVRKHTARVAGLLWTRAMAGFRRTTAHPTVSPSGSSYTSVGDGPGSSSSSSSIGEDALPPTPSLGSASSVGTWFVVLTIVEAWLAFRFSWDDTEVPGGLRPHTMHWRRIYITFFEWVERAASGHGAQYWVAVATAAAVASFAHKLLEGRDRFRMWAGIARAALWHALWGIVALIAVHRMAYAALVLLAAQMAEEHARRAFEYSRIVLLSVDTTA